MLEQPVVELREITKSFSGVQALSRVSLKAYAGRCLGLVGENGAGKSTLMKILSGVWPHGDFTGEILLEGQLQCFEGPRFAREAGIAIIHQELSLFDELSVAENISIADLPSHGRVVDRKAVFDRARHLLAQFDFHIDPEEKVKHLRMGERQLVEIARAFTKPVKVLIFDEPTSALSDKEITTLFRLIRELKAKGVACIYISHKFPEIHALCDDIVVLRDGCSVASFVSDGLDDQKLIEAMVGRKIAHIFPSKRDYDPERKVILKVEDLQYIDSKTQRPLLKNISFDVREGEIFGIAGLMGSRRTELVSALFGCLKATKVSGRLSLFGKICVD